MSITVVIDVITNFGDFGVRFARYDGPQSGSVLGLMLPILGQGEADNCAPSQRDSHTIGFVQASFILIRV